jgi:hypothetical protein
MFRLSGILGWNTFNIFDARRFVKAKLLGPLLAFLVCTLFLIGDLVFLICSSCAHVLCSLYLVGSASLTSCVEGLGILSLTCLGKYDGWIAGCFHNLCIIQLIDLFGHLAG